MKLSKKVQDRIQKVRKKVIDQVVTVVKSLSSKDLKVTKVEALHAINTIFNRNDGEHMFRPVNWFSRKFRQTEIETLSDIWMPQEDREEMAIAERFFQRNLTRVSRGSRMTASSALPVDPAPALTAEEAVLLVQSGKYKWVTKNGVMCLASTADAPRLRVIGKAVSVTRL